MRALVVAALAAASLLGRGPRGASRPPSRASRSTSAGLLNEPGPAFASDSSLSGEQKKDGSYSHKAWITAARDIDNESTPSYVPHRAYPTFQFQETPEGR